jgi:hypothetical protein
VEEMSKALIWCNLIKHLSKGIIATDGINEFILALLPEFCQGGIV